MEGVDLSRALSLGLYCNLHHPADIFAPCSSGPSGIVYFPAGTVLLYSPSSYAGFHSFAAGVRPFGNPLAADSVPSCNPLYNRLPPLSGDRRGLNIYPVNLPGDS